MSRIKLKCGGKRRPKAFLGADGAVMATATLAAAGMTTAATISSANKQAKSIEENAKQQAQALEQQNINNNQLQTESLAFTRQQNQENRQQQQDIQTTLQMLAGQQNMNDVMERNKVQVKNGGRPKRRKLNSIPFYGGGRQPFTVTDGGGVLPIQVDANGYGLYELYGNDHEHYHKTPGGKMKTGVGIKFADGGVVEGEGNQGTDQGELMYIKPGNNYNFSFNRNMAKNGFGNNDDIMFISKHSIKGFNPAKAVDNGMHPEQAFAYQEAIKDTYGISDDGKKVKCGGHRKLRKSYGGQQIIMDNANITQLPSNGTAPVAGGVIYVTQPTLTTSPVEKFKCGGRKKAAYGFQRTINPGNRLASIKNLNINTINTTPVSLGNTSVNTGSSVSRVLNTPYGGAIINSAGNIGGAVLNTIGNLYASNKLGKAYTRAGNLIADAYDKWTGIDLNNIKQEDYAAAHAMANVRYANLNNNAELESIRRQGEAEKKLIRQTNVSDAAKNTRMIAVDDRIRLANSRAIAQNNNENERIKQENFNTINQTAQFNAQQDNVSRQDYSRTMLQAMMYNNDINNAKIAGAAQARADAMTQRASLAGSAMRNSLNSIGNAVGATGNAFSTAWNNERNYQIDYRNSLLGYDDAAQINSVISENNRAEAWRLYQQHKANGDNSISKAYVERLRKHFNFA